VHDAKAGASSLIAKHVAGSKAYWFSPVFQARESGRSRPGAFLLPGRHPLSPAAIPFARAHRNVKATILRPGERLDEDTAAARPLAVVGRNFACS
jgi:hypothetical protein